MLTKDVFLFFIKCTYFYTIYAYVLNNIRKEMDYHLQTLKNCNQANLILKDLFFVQEVEKHLQEVACGEEQVNQLNRELSTQMAEMVKEFDEDKQQAIER